MNHAYHKAMSRSDLNHWVVHYIRTQNVISPGQLGTAADALQNIFRENFVRPSVQKHVIKYASEGAACFYDAPPAIWPEIMETNKKRQPLGIICHKHTFWWLGGRPVIYSEHQDPEIWPASERFRVVETNPFRTPDPLDWTHEREWRIKGGLNLNQPAISDVWWWPVVPAENWLPYLWENYPGITDVYVVESKGVVKRPP